MYCVHCRSGFVLPADLNALWENGNSEGDGSEKSLGEDVKSKCKFITQLRDIFNFDLVNVGKVT